VRFPHPFFLFFFFFFLRRNRSLKFAPSNYSETSGEATLPPLHLSALWITLPEHRNLPIKVIPWKPNRWKYPNL